MPEMASTPHVNSHTSGERIQQKKPKPLGRERVAECWNILSKYAVSVSKETSCNDEYPLIGQREYLDAIVSSVDAGNSVLLVGPPGVGKRSMSIGLTRALAAKSNDKRQVFRVALGTKFWIDANHGDKKEVNRRIRAVLDAACTLGTSRVILFIDDIDVLTVLNSKGNTRTGKKSRDYHKESSAKAHCDQPKEFDATASCENFLKSLLLDRLLVCVCTCEEGAYNRFLRRDSFYDDKFTVNFRVLWVREPDVKQARAMIRSHKRRLEKKFTVKIDEDALSVATSLAAQYISHRCLPEKAIDVMEEACTRTKAEARRRRSRKNAVGGSSSGRDVNPARSPTSSQVRSSDVHLLVSEWCKLPRERLEMHVAS